MIFILSPAKTFRTSPLMIDSKTDPMFSNKTDHLHKLLMEKSLEEYKELFHCSEAVAKKTKEYYLNPTNKSAALGCFHGEAFRNIHAETMDESDWSYAQQHLFILSAYYGILRSQDAIVPHRLDPSDKLMEESLTQYWKNKVTDFLNNKEIISLASMEYATMLQGIPFYQVEFYQNNKLAHSMLAKKLRGITARMCIELKVETFSQFCKLEIEGFTCKDMSANKIKFEKV